MVAEWRALFGGWCPGLAGRSAHVAEELTVHHIVPLSAGGTSARVNLMVACRACNAAEVGAAGTRDRGGRGARVFEPSRRHPLPVSLARVQQKKARPFNVA